MRGAAGMIRSPRGGVNRLGFRDRAGPERARGSHRPSARSLRSAMSWARRRSWIGARRPRQSCVGANHRALPVPRPHSG